MRKDSTDSESRISPKCRIGRILIGKSGDYILPIVIYERDHNKPLKGYIRIPIKQPGVPIQRQGTPFFFCVTHLDVEHAGGNNSKRHHLQGSNELGQMQVPFGQFVSWRCDFYRGLFLGLLTIGFP